MPNFTEENLIPHVWPKSASFDCKTWPVLQRLVDASENCSDVDQRFTEDLSESHYFVIETEQQSIVFIVMTQTSDYKRYSRTQLTERSSL